MRPSWVLFFVFHASIGVYFSYETPGALAFLLEQQYGLTTQEIGFLYSGYSVPSFITLFLASYCVEKFGNVKTLAVSTLICTAGTVIMGFGRSFWPLMVGMIVFGAGGSSAYNAVLNLIGTWWIDLPKTMQNKRTSIAHGLCKCWLRGGSFAAFVTLPIVATNYGLDKAVWYSAIIAGSGAVAAWAFLILDKFVLKNDEYGSSTERDDSIPLTKDDSGSSSLKSFESDKPKGIKGYLSAIKEMPFSFWLLSAIAMLFIGDLYTFTAFLPSFLMSDYGMSLETSSTMTSLVCLANVATSPFCGLLFGHIGRRTDFIMLGATLLGAVHATFAFTTKVYPWIMIIGMGLIQSVLDTNVYPSIAIVLPPRVLNIGYTISSLMSNISLLIFPILGGFLHDHFNTWFYVQLFFCANAAAALLVGIVLKIVDLRAGGLLSRSRAARESMIGKVR